MHNIIKYQGGKKFKNTKVGAFAGKYGDALGAAGSMFSGIGGQIKGFTETQSSINSGIHSLMQAAGPAGQLASAAVGVFDTIGGVLFLMNTVGGDVSAGLALSEMIASMHKPTVSLVIGDSHSIGVPLAVSTDYSFIVPTATMIVHPVRMNGNIIGARQTYDYFERIQKRIVSFIARKSDTKEKEVENMMMNTEMLTKDLGTILVGEDAVKAGLINEVGGISHAFNKIKELMNKEE